MNVDQIFQQAVESLTPSDRLRLATMLLETLSSSVVVDDSEEWSDQDIKEYRDHCRKRWDAREGALEDEPNAQAG